MGCKNCGSNAIEYDSAAGNAFCVSCGAVTEENTIVSEVTFGESSNGAAILQGAMVSNDTGRLNLSGHYGKHNAVQSREKTLSNGKRAIFSLGTALRLSDRFKEAAHRYYTLAVNCNFNKGRPTQNVAAACLYIVCRQEKSGQMLMDFSDILQTNVFLLGVTFVRLVRQLNLILPMVDPSLYMARFAMRLEFGDKTQRVTMDALRLAQRMDRDWLLTGRRPAGVCGACLLIAARMHNFHRTYDEMIRVVKVASVTIQERLREFKRTPTSALSMADFRNVWLEESCDPPAFTRNRQAHLKVHHHAHHLYREEMGDAPPHESAEPVERSAKRRALEGGLRGDGDEDGATNDAREDHRDGEYRLPSAKVKADGTDETEEDEDDEAEDEAGDEPSARPRRANPLPPSTANATLGQQDRALMAEINRLVTDGRLNLLSKQLADEKQYGEDVAEWKDFDDDEVTLAILDPDEVEVKTSLWMSNNADWLELQEIKKAVEDNRGTSINVAAKRKRAKAAAAGGGGGGGHGGFSNGPSASAMEAAQRLLHVKKLSKKINHGVLETLFDTKPSVATGGGRQATPNNPYMAAGFAPVTALRDRAAALGALKSENGSEVGGGGDDDDENHIGAPKGTTSTTTTGSPGDGGGVLEIVEADVLINTKAPPPPAPAAEDDEDDEDEGDYEEELVHVGAVDDHYGDDYDDYNEDDY